MTISSLAKNVHVSNATITRFVKKMGCANFYAFKLQLAEGAVTPVTPAGKKTPLRIKSIATTKKF